jgi:hypothetical protein
VVPVLPFAILWDGVVSYLRAYTPDELLAMANEVEPHGYMWASGYQTAANVPGRMTYLTGVPVKLSASKDMTGNAFQSRQS